MTVPSQTSRNDYLGNGQTDTYDFTFKVLDSADLLVTMTDTDDVETALVEGEDYTVDGIGETAGGTITLLAGNLASGYALTLRRNPEIKQETDYRNQGTYQAETVEDGIDRLTMIAQSLDELTRRGSLLPPTDPGDPPIGETGDPITGLTAVFVAKITDEPDEYGQHPFVEQIATTGGGWTDREDALTGSAETLNRCLDDYTGKYVLMMQFLGISGTLYRFEPPAACASA